MGTSYVYLNSRYWPTRQKATSQIFIALWFVNFAPQRHIIHAVVFQATEPSRQLYTSFLEKLGQSYKPEKIHGRTESSLPSFLPDAQWFFQPADGKFGAMMNVSLTNEVRNTTH